MLLIESLVKRFGGLTATDNLSLSVARGEIHAVIGPNGAGKTTLIQQVCGEQTPDFGRIVFEGRDITRDAPHRRALAGLGRSYQVTSVFPEFNALENVMLAVQAHAGHSFRFWHPAREEAALLEPARSALARVGLSHAAGEPVADMAHGERRQLEIAMTLATQPKLLLLDEPLAGMSHRESEEMISLIASMRGGYTILMVEHDMDAVFALADRITVLVYGQALVTGTPDEIRDNTEVQQAYLGMQQELVDDATA